MSYNVKNELNEIVALAYNANIGFATARKRLIQHCNVKRMSVKALFAKPTTPNTSREPGVYEYEGHTGTLLMLAYWNDMTVDGIRNVLRNVGKMPNVFNEYADDPNSAFNCKPQPRRNISDLPPNGTWEDKHIKDNYYE